MMIDQYYYPRGWQHTFRVICPKCKGINTEIYARDRDMFATLFKLKCKDKVCKYVSDEYWSILDLVKDTDKELFNNLEVLYNDDKD